MTRDHALWRRSGRTARPRKRLLHVDGLAGAGGAVRLVLADHDRKHDLGLCRRRAAAGRRYRQPDDAAAAGLPARARWCRSGTRSTSPRWARSAASSWRCRWRSWRRATPRRRSIFCGPSALFIIVASRSINSLIWALLLVAIIGPGILAGIVAIALRSIGFVGKLLYEAIEETDARQVEAVQATGASPAQVLSYGIVPQIMPAFWGISVFRWDINIRESTILGLVGAGGIGLKLQASLNMLAWPQVTVILLLILATVVLERMGLGADAPRDHLTARRRVLRR
ncbi:MAG: ABC transporter permease subunit [Roseovarius sp.]|nr:ABC transporter permease subunit [Roseovarius sp.]